MKMKGKRRGRMIHNLPHIYSSSTLYLAKSSRGSVVLLHRIARFPFTVRKDGDNIYKTLERKRKNKRQNNMLYKIIHGRTSENETKTTVRRT